MPSPHMLPNLVHVTTDPFTCMVCGQTVRRDQMNVSKMAHLECISLNDAWGAMATDDGIKDKGEG